MVYQPDLVRNDFYHPGRQASPVRAMMFGRIWWCTRLNETYMSCAASVPADHSPGRALDHQDKTYPSHPQASGVLFVLMCSIDSTDPEQRLNRFHDSPDPWLGDPILRQR